MNHWMLCCFFLLLQQLSPLMASSSPLIRNLPGFTGDLPFQLRTGYIGVGEAEELQIFYLFVESQRNPSQDPVLFLLTGGPGCTGLSGFFLGSGPFIFDNTYDGKFPKLELNPYAWTQLLNVIFVDLPVGTGFSYSETQQGYYSSDTIWVDQAYGFLQKWFIENPNFGSNPLYIAAGSYSGIAAAPLVQKVYEGNKAGSKPLMNLKGYVLGSPFADYRMDRNNKIEYAYRMALLSEDLYQSLKINCNGDYIDINPNNTKCVSDYQTFSDLVSDLNEQQILEPDCSDILDEKQRILIQDSETTLQSIQNPYTWCRYYYSVLLEIWANEEEVLEALHVRKGTTGEFKRCNESLAYIKNVADVVEFHRNLTYTNLRSLIYCADLDMAVPHFGTQYWIKSLNLTVDYPWRAWFVEGQVAGYTEIYERNDDFYLTYVAVKGSGHLAERYKPREVYNMIERWFSYSVI